MNTSALDAAVAAPSNASTSRLAVPRDRVNELYRGEIFTEETARIARDRIHWMCAQCEGDSVLDVGCSQGITAILLARSGFRVTAIDTHPESVAFAKQEFSLETPLVQGRLTLVETDLGSLPVDPAFDTIVLGEVLEHQALPERFVRAAANRVRPGGRLIITTPFALHPHPDHKISVLPRHMVELAGEIGLQILHLDVHDQYIRCILARPLPGATALAIEVDLLGLTERAVLRSQERLFERLSAQSDTLKKRADALKIAQRKLNEAIASAEARAAEQQRVAEKLDELQEQVRAHAQVKAALEAQTQRWREELANREARLSANEQQLTFLQAEHRQAMQSMRHELEREARAAADAVAAQLATLNESRASILRLGAEHEEQVLSLRSDFEQRLRDSESRLAAAALSQQESENLLARAKESLVRTHAEHRVSMNDARAAMSTLRRREAQVTRQLSEAVKRQRKGAVALRVATAEAKTLSIKATSLGREVRGLRQGEAALLAQLNILRSNLALEKARAREHIGKLKAAAAATKKASSYRLGRALVRSVKSVRGLLELPGELWSIGRDALARRRIRSTLPAGTVQRMEEAVVPTKKQTAVLAHSVELEFDRLLSLFEADGLAALVGHLQTLGGRLGKHLVAVRMLQLGKVLAGKGHAEAELELATSALAMDRSDATLRGYFWVAQRTRRFEQACEAIRGLEALYGPKPSKEQLETLNRLRVSPAYQLTLLSLVVDKPIETIEPVARRICYVLHNSLPYSSGGYGTRSHGVASGLSANGFEVVVLTRPGFPIDVNANLNESDIPLEDVIEGIRYLRTLQPGRRGLSLLNYVNQAAVAIERRLREQRPAIVLAASNHVTALPALIAARRLGLPFIYEVRGLWEITRMSRDQSFEDTASFAVQRLLESKVAQLADQVFTLTEPMREELIERGVAAEKIELLPNSCDPDRFLPRPRDEALATRLGIPQGVPVIGYIGTFVDYEGLEDLASACALLKQRGVSFRLLLVGNENASGLERGPITAKIQDIATSEGFSDWLTMPGRVPHDEVESYYSLIDIAPFPRKPWPVCEMVSPMKPLEALAMEKAVLVSSVRALTEMIADGETGSVFDKGSIDSLAQRLGELIAAPEQRAKLGRQGREWVCAHRTWTSMTRRFEGHYLQLVKPTT